MKNIKILFFPALFLAASVFGFISGDMNFFASERNEGQALFGSLKFQKMEVIRESDKNENYSFLGVNSLAVDSEDNIYLLDVKGGGRLGRGTIQGVESSASVRVPTSRILVYNKKGEFLRSAGRLGQGPGEFTFPSRLFIDKEDYLYVLDMGKIIVFDKNGRFDRNITFPFRTDPAMNDFIVLDRRIVYALGEEYSASEINKFLFRYDVETQAVSKLDNYIDQERIVKKGSRGQTMMSRTVHEYSKRQILRFFPDNCLCYGVNDEFKLKVYDRSGEMIKNIMRKEKPKAFAKDEKNKALTIIEKIPAFIPVFREIFADEMGRIFVFRPGSIFDKQPVRKLDVFSLDGQHLYQTTFPNLPVDLKNGFFYVIDSDAGDKQIITKYMIENYHALKY
jgi:hypothetical protein